MNSIRKQCLLATGGAIALWASPAMAQDTTTTYVDLTGSIGFATNPFIRTVDSQSSVLGRASARGVHSWAGERTTASIHGFVEGTTYFNDYGLESIFNLGGNVSHQASETVTVFGSAGFSGDLSGQLSNRFLYVPPIAEVPDPTIPPPPPTIENPDAFDFAGRTYHLYGQAGASIQTGLRSHVTVSAGASRAIYDAPGLDEYTSIWGTGAYTLTLSERTTVGATLHATHTGYDNSSNNSTIINPGLTINTQLSEDWNASGSIGVSFAHVERTLTDDSSTNLSLSGNICHTTGESDRLCAYVDRYSAASASSTVLTTTSAGVSWYKKLDERQTLQLSASVSHYVDEVLNINRDVNYFSLAASYSRMINDRLSAGADLGARSLHRDGIEDPDTDITGTVFIRYRIGDLG